MDNHFMEYLSARIDATASDLKTSLHETVDSRLGRFKSELNSIIRSGVIESIRAQGGNQHWRVETTYTPVSPYQQNLPLELPSIASHSTGFIQGIPPPLLTDHEEGTASAGMSKVDQCIADVTFPSGHSVSIPLFDTVRNDSEDIPEQSQQSEQTQDQLPSSSGESRTDFSLGPNLNNTEQNTLQTQNTQNSQSQVVETNVEHPLNGNIASDDVEGENDQGPIDETNTEAPNINQLMMTPSTSGCINTGARSTNQIAPRKSAFHTVQPSVDNDDDEDSGSEDEGHYSQNRELTTTQSKRKSVSSCDQSNKKAKHVDQIIDNDNDENGKSTKTIYLNCTESDCGDHLNSMDDLYQHLTTKHGLLPYQCYARECNFRCKYPRRLFLHLRVHHTDSTDFVCPVCAIQLASQVDVSNHRYNHHTGKFQCNIVDECKQVGATRREISFHLQRCNYHRPSTRLQCDQCSFSFPNKTKLNSHYKVHTRFNSFRCTWPDCLYQTNWHSAIIRHIRVKHFHLPVTKKEQLAENIMDDRDPADYFEEEITEQGGL